MKNVIVMLFTIILAVYIGSTYIMGDGGAQTSFKEVADKIGVHVTGELSTLESYTSGTE